MIRQGLDDPAFPDHAMSAGPDHLLEIRFQRPQAGEAAIDFRELPARDGIGLLAGLIWPVGQLLKRPQIIQAEAQLAAMADEAQTVEMMAVIAPLPARRARRFGHQPDAFVVADGGDFYPASGRQGPDGEV